MNLPASAFALLMIGALGACETVPSATEAAVAEAPLIDAATGAGIYFPPPTSFESPQVRFAQMGGVGANQRQLFVDQVNVAATNTGRSVPVVAQAVGSENHTLVLIYLTAENDMTPYLARGILARLTSIARFAPAIAEMGLTAEFDIYNMAAVMGFERIVVSDGRSFAHQANLTGN